MILTGDDSHKVTNFYNEEEKTKIRIEGYMMRRANEKQFKTYYYKVLGKELYMFKKSKEYDHKKMYNLIGNFIEDMPQVEVDGKVFFPFRLTQPPNQAREFYLKSEDDKSKWVKVIKKVIGYANLFDYYKFTGEILGKGKFGLVKAAIHIKSQKKVAIKIISRKEMQPDDYVLQRREIEILKQC